MAKTQKRSIFCEDVHFEAIDAFAIYKFFILRS